MRSYSFKTVYIIVLWVALGTLIVPAKSNTAHAQINLPRVTGGLTGLPQELDVDRSLLSRVDRERDNATEMAAVWVDTTELTVEQATAQAAGVTSGLLRNLQVGQDPAGADIEERIVVVLVDTERLDTLSRSGFEVVAARNMSSLGMTMLTLRLPVNGDLPQAVQVLRDANPGVAVDYNHLYHFTTASLPTPSSSVEEEAPRTIAERGATLRVGIVDSAVMRDHRAIAGMKIVDRDFATAPGLRPQTHGTAVASLVARSSNGQSEVYAASVFFQMANHAPGATAESLVAALDWLVGEQVDAINMSLAGPGNLLLEAAIARLIQQNAIIVAAVGNNGPKGDPLYPAAYDGVIGVTAVDRKNKIFRYANRGEQVQFAARGVDVKVADSLSGGWRIESGTSMASPHVAVIAAQLLHSGTVSPNAVTSWLMANAEDLGRKGFDRVYGYGLITQPPVVVSAN